MHCKVNFFPRFLLHIFVVLTLSLSSCGKPPEKAAGEAAEGAGGGTPAVAETSSLTEFLPSAEKAEGWKLVGQARTFVADNLWEYINGGAEGYLVYNFEAVVTADYETEDGSLQAVMDIYKMADRLCGFGIFATERAYDARNLDIGSEGYLTENALHFWQGPYYVKITAFETGAGEKLEKLARAVAGSLDAASGMPEQLEAFPGEGLIDESQRYLARDVLGHSELKNGFTADYKLADKEFKAFFILHDNTEMAQRSFIVYREFMEKYGKNVEFNAGAEVPLFTAEDSYYGTVVAMQSGKAVLGILGLDDPELVNRYLQQMATMLSRQGMV